ncbi:MAG: alpha/beta hydrolase, partial [Candidatus Heimdallarchaeota archaeon]
MENPRKYGKAPFTIAVIHGGPGAQGEMAPVARELSSVWGILEPFQSFGTIEEQIQELQTLLKMHAHLPITLIGHSWGAWLSFIFAARHSSSVKKLILIGSGPFEEKYAYGIMETRLSRLNIGERKKVQVLEEALNDPNVKEKNAILAQFRKLMLKTDSFDPLPVQSEEIEFQHDIFQSVWKEASELRRSGKL